MQNPHYLADRLRAHARLYRHIAAATWSEVKARELVRLADECARMADTVAAGETVPPAPSAPSKPRV